ncbi:MAG: ComEC/Rec2 family competence protein [Spirochaetia bacterium]|nr:ComEC/Rec2 family competence protein [Spirochaetia bacterium]
MSETIPIPLKLSGKQKYPYPGLKSDKFLLIKKYYYDLFILLLVALSAVCLLPILRTSLPFIPFESDNISCLEGVLISDSKSMRGGKELYSLKLRSAESKTGISAEVKGLVKIISRGDPLYRGSFVKIEKPDFIQYDYSVPLFFQSVPVINGYNSMLLYSPESVVLRKKAADYIFSGIKKIETKSGLIAALLIGNRRGLDPGLADNIRKSGCSHLLALSGMHLGILTMIIFVILKRAAGIRFSIIASLLFNFLFALFAGMSASLLRAFLFFLLVTIARLSGRKGDFRKLIVLCLLLAVIAAPDEAGELSFQYSFLAVSGIIFLTDYIYKIIPGIIPPFIAAPLACTLAAQIPSYVLSAIVFNEIYLSGLAASLILTPLVTLLMLLAFPLLIIVFFTGNILPVFSYLLETLSSITGKAASFFSLMPPFKTGVFSIYLLIIINLFVIVFAMFPLQPHKLFKFLKRYR